MVLPIVIDPFTGVDLNSRQALSVFDPTFIYTCKLAFGSRPWTVQQAVNMGCNRGKSPYRPLELVIRVPNSKFNRYYVEYLGLDPNWYANLVNQVKRVNQIKDNIVLLSSDGALLSEYSPEDLFRMRFTDVFEARIVSKGLLCEEEEDDSNLDGSFGATSGDQYSNASLENLIFRSLFDRLEEEATKRKTTISNIISDKKNLAQFLSESLGSSRCKKAIDDVKMTSAGLQTIVEHTVAEISNAWNNSAGDNRKKIASIGCPFCPGQQVSEQSEFVAAKIGCPFCPAQAVSDWSTNGYQQQQSSFAPQPIASSFNGKNYAYKPDVSQSNHDFIGMHLLPHKHRHDNQGTTTTTDGNSTSEGTNKPIGVGFVPIPYNSHPVATLYSGKKHHHHHHDEDRTGPGWAGDYSSSDDDDERSSGRNTSPYRKRIGTPFEEEDYQRTSSKQYPPAGSSNIGESSDDDDNNSDKYNRVSRISYGNTKEPTRKEDTFPDESNNEDRVGNEYENYPFQSSYYPNSRDQHPYSNYYQSPRQRRYHGSGKPYWNYTQNQYPAIRYGGKGDEGRLDVLRNAFISSSFFTGIIMRTSKSMKEGASKLWDLQKIPALLDLVENSDDKQAEQKPSQHNTPKQTEMLKGSSGKLPKINIFSREGFEKMLPIITSSTPEIHGLRLYDIDFEDEELEDSLDTTGGLSKHTKPNSAGFTISTKQSGNNSYSLIEAYSESTENPQSSNFVELLDGSKWFSDLLSKISGSNTNGNKSVNKSLVIFAPTNDLLTDKTMKGFKNNPGNVDSYIKKMVCESPKERKPFNNPSVYTSSDLLFETLATFSGLGITGKDKTYSAKGRVKIPNPFGIKIFVISHSIPLGSIPTISSQKAPGIIKSHKRGNKSGF